MTNISRGELISALNVIIDNQRKLANMIALSVVVETEEAIVLAIDRVQDSVQAVL